MTRSRQVATGSVDVSLIITIVDDTGLPVTGLVAATFPGIYLQLTGVVTPSALSLSDLAAQNSAHSDGGVKELTGGRYRLDVPDAPFATENTIDVIGEATGKRVIHPQIEVRGDASVPGDEMDFIDSPNVTALTAIGAKLELMILDEGDATALLAAISAKVEEFLINEGDATATMAAIAAAVRTNLTTELGRIDVAISTRNATAPDNTQGAAVITALGDGTVVLHADYDPAKDAASQYTADADHDLTQSAILLLNFATPKNVTDAQTAIIAEIDANETKIDAGNAVLGKLNSGLESDGSGGYQGTALFLENGPSSGGDATEANQLQILADISDVQTAVDAIDVGAGSGPSVVTIAVVDQDDNELEDVVVRLTDFAARNYVSTTNASGVINPLIGAEDATYTLVLSKDGYGNSVTTLVVSGDTSPVAYVLTATVITPASNPAKSTLTVTCYDEFGNIEPGAIVSIQFAVIPSGDNARSYDKKPAEAIADGSGVASFDGGDGSGGVVRLARYHVWRGSGPKSLISIPDAATCTVTSFLGREIE